MMTYGEFQHFSQNFSDLTRAIERLAGQVDIQSKKLDQLCEHAEKSRFTDLTAESRELWTVQEVANYLGVSYEYVSRDVVHAPDFPAAVELPNRGNKRSQKRWIAGQVVAWFERKQAKNQQHKRDTFRGGR